MTLIDPTLYINGVKVGAIERIDLPDLRIIMGRRRVKPDVIPSFTETIILVKRTHERMAITFAAIDILDRTVRIDKRLKQISKALRFMDKGGCKI